MAQVPEGGHYQAMASAPPSPEFVEVAPQAAGWWGRGAALALDGAIAVAVGLSVYALARAWGSGEDDAATLAGLSLLGAWMVSTALCTQLTGGQTPGKLLAGIRTVRQDGQPQTWWRSLLRDTLYRGLFLLGLVLIVIDYGWALGQARQCVHDKMAGTQVLREADYDRRVRWAGALALVLVVAWLGITTIIDY